MPNYDPKYQAQINAANEAELERVRQQYGGATPSGKFVNPYGRNNQEAFAFQANAEDPNQSNLERNAERRQNFYYGGSADYADQQQAALKASQTAAGTQYGAAAGRAATSAAAASSRSPGAFINAPAVNAANDAANRQTDVYSAIMRNAAQPGESAAQAQLRSATSRAMSDQLSLARSGRGMGESASALRQARSNASRIQSDAANQSAVLRAQEDQAFRDRQLQAYGAAAGVAGQQRGQALQTGQYTSGVMQAGQAQADQTALGYGQLGLSAMEGGTQADLGYYGAQGQVAGGMSASNQGYEGNLLDRYLGQRQTRGAPGKGFVEQAAPYAAAAATLLASDIRVKRDIEPANASAAFDMRYHSPNDYYPPGEVPGPIARPSDLSPYRLEDVGKSREQLEREAAFDMRIADQGAMPPAGQAPVSIRRPYRKEDVGKSREQLEREELGQASESEPFTYRREDIGKSREQLAREATPSKETTALKPDEEQAFQKWAKRQNITDVDHPESYYDYRGYWKDTGGNADIVGGRDHFPDTYKQHGHPTFSTESRYSRGSWDGGRWNGETFVPSDESKRNSPRKQTEPDKSKKPVSRANKKPASDALSQAPAYSYRYKNPEAYGYADKRYTGPMAQDLAETPEGRTAVVESPDGTLGVDTGRLSLLNASAFGEQQDELAQLRREVASLRRKKAA